MQITKVTIPAREVATFTDIMTGETVENAELTPVTITIDGKASETLYFSPTSLVAVRAIAAEDGEGFREHFTPAKRSGAGRASGPTTNTYPGTNQVVKTVRKWAQANGGTKVDGSPVTDSARFTLSDETFAKMLAANPGWAASASADAKPDASADAKPSGITVATAPKK
jgi:hypothetical protein